MNLQDVTRKYYTEQNYNCSETLLHACNEYYGLNLKEDDMKLVSGFGGGMFVGSTCGALIGCVAALSKKIIETKAHEQIDTIRPAIQKCVINFKKELNATNCSEIKPHFHSKETGCLNTCLHAAKAMEQTMDELGIKSAL
ncbi:C-GCAxxG-C-C family protein [Floccifex sp.]|uniref:C-GCAxxG-C-C family protein n=1 Tax=Floccifex sp. TaxID=2815810 RepID=UPI002A751A9D|nr:C-GCAxxG-C-C family (seleno)protein [Floccifex sp.]MDY2958032.1 C-GCAxxG-C-C family (seleno)protein [Floccifex sp.]